MKIKVALPITGKEEYESVKDVIYSGNFVSGKKVEQFEKSFARYNNVKYGCAVNSGTAALHLINIVLDFKEGDEIIVPPLTFISSITPLMYQRLKPVFADIDADSFCIKPEDIEKRITKKTKGVIAVHFAGNSCDMRAIKKICNKYSLHLIEDCAQAHGTEYYNQKVGSFGIASAFSFYPTKHMTTGEGGIILSNNKKFINKCKMVRNHGLKDRSNHIYIGYNYRMSELNAAIGLEQIKKLQYVIKKKIEISNKLLSGIKKSNQKCFIVPNFNKNIKHTFFLCPLILDINKGYDVKKIINHFRKFNVEVRLRYFEPLYKQKIFNDYFNLYTKGQNYKKLFLKNAEMLCGNIIGLPNHPLITKKEINYIIKVIELIK